MKTIKEGIEEHKKFKQDIKDGKSQGLLTPYNNLNKATNNGLPWNTVTTIAALSGVGKTTLMLNICLNAPILNPNTAVLIFSLEMPIRSIISRRLSNLLKESVKDINSPELEIDYSVLKDIEDLPIYLDEQGGTPDQIYNKMDAFIKKHDPNTNVLIALDHSLLIDGSNDNDKIAEICRLINKLKVKHTNSSFIIISQLNDSMMKEERLNKRGVLMFPQYLDLYYGRPLYHVSDIVLAINNPSVYVEEEKTTTNKRYEREYGGFPLFINNGISKKSLIYGHIIKGRDVGKSIIRWVNQLEDNELIEDSMIIRV